jgi:hypothetical protein
MRERNGILSRKDPPMTSLYDLASPLPCLLVMLLLSSATLLLVHLVDRLYDVSDASAFPDEADDLHDVLLPSPAPPTAVSPSSPTAAEAPAQAHSARMRRIYAELMTEQKLFGDVIQQEVSPTNNDPHR